MWEDEHSNLSSVIPLSQWVMKRKVANKHNVKWIYGIMVALSFPINEYDQREQHEGYINATEATRRPGERDKRKGKTIEQIGAGRS